MVRGVIFDLGGTLAAPENHLADDALDRLNAGGLLRWLRQRGLQVDGDFVEALVEDGRATGVKGARVPARVTPLDAWRPALHRSHRRHDEASSVDREEPFFHPDRPPIAPLPAP